MRGKRRAPQSYTFRWSAAERRAATRTARRARMALSAFVRRAAAIMSGLEPHAVTFTPPPLEPPAKEN